MAKGGTTTKKQSKLSPSKGQLKILNFFKAASIVPPTVALVVPLPATATTASPPVVVISDDDDVETVQKKTPGKKGKRKRVEVEVSADFIPGTPIQQRDRKTRKKVQQKQGETLHTESGFPVNSPEHKIYTYVTEVLKIENAVKIQPKRLFDDNTSNSKSGSSHFDPAPQTSKDEDKRIEKESVSVKNEQSAKKTTTISVVVNKSPTNIDVTDSKHAPVITSAKASDEGLAERPGVAKADAETMKPDQSNKGSVDVLFQDLLLDEWDLGDAFEEETSATPLDLTSLTRCFVISSSRLGSSLRLTVRADANPTTANTEVLIKLPWSDCQIDEGEVVSIQAGQTVPSDWVSDPALKADWIVDYKAGMLVLKPDTLLSTTTVVGSLFCARKAVLAAMFPGGDPANKVMLLGTLVHEIAQTVLRSEEVPTESSTLALASELLSSRRHLSAMFAAGLDVQCVLRDVRDFVPNIVALANRRPTAGTWQGRMCQVLDTEENIWSPRLGLKGKVDLTAEVLDGSERYVAPLEIKTGRASGSAEHRGQVMLYQAMLQDMGIPCQAGVLLYLRDGVADRVTANQSESSGLVSLRNRLVPYLARPSTRLVLPIESQSSNQDATLDAFPPPSLPAPITHHSACARCPQLTVCSLFANATPETVVTPDNPLLPLLATSTAHLAPEHVKYFMRWVALLAMEASEPQGASQSILWTLPPSQRPRCLPNLRVVEGNDSESSTEICLEIGSLPSGGNGLTQVSDPIGQAQLEGHAPLKEGDYIALSSDARPALYTGTLLAFEGRQVRVMLDRPMRVEHAAMPLHLDALAVADSGAMTRGFMRLLAEDSEKGARLRTVIIDRQPPTFSKLPSSVLVKGKDIFTTLNEGQRAAVLKALSTESFLLIKGMPGSGKTHTVSALVDLLVATGKSVLLTSHTHSAVDTLLTKVMSRGVPVLRLGAEARISSALRHRTETALLGTCRTPDELGKAFELIPVVGCTCLGANHPLLTHRVFDVCIVDESTQVLQPLVLRALTSAKKFILVGDPDQLAPVVRHRAARALGMDQSLFARLDGLGATTALDHQYRMNGPITALANAVTYRGQLQCANQQVAAATLRTVTKVPHEPWLTQTLSDELADSVVFLDTGRVPVQDAGAKDSISNEREAALVARLVDAFRSLGIPGSALGVMATYRAQVQLLQRTLATAGPEVNTIDQFQGRDKEVVVLSCTRSDPEGHDYSKQDQELLGDPRRLTVALTRARHKLVIVGDAVTLTNFAPFARLLRSLDQRYVVRLQEGEDGFSWSQ